MLKMQWLVAVGALTFACSPDMGTPCRPGSENCACDEERCLTGLACVEHVCRASSGPNADASTDGGVASDSGSASDSAVSRDVGPNPDAFFATDPPPMICLEDGGMGPAPTPPGGTPECPDDKNREGCPCANIGQQAACWPGLRANRMRGICHDGVTTCRAYDEFGGTWGPCEGAVLPVPGVVRGPQACGCFSAGRWELENLIPCTITMGGQQTAVSTAMVGGVAQCPSQAQIGAGPPFASPPAGPIWGQDHLTVDCEGRFNLCYTIRAGSFDAPAATDCVVGESCVEAWYPTRNVRQMLPPMPGWVGADNACTARFNSIGGYGEMSVRGLSAECDRVGNPDDSRYVFNRIRYCPSSCGTNPTAPECMNCGNGGSGNF